MTHDEIAAQNIAERYVMGKLSSDESARFEEHFVDCSDCLDRLETTERFRAALKPLANEILRSPAVRAGWWGWPRSAWLVAAGLVLAVSSSVFLGIRGLRTQRELEMTRIVSLNWQNRYERERVAAKAPVPAAQSGPAEPLVASSFYLSTTRGGESEISEPTNRVTVTSDPHWVVLSLDGELEPAFQSLRASLMDSANKEIWQQTGLRTTPHEALSVILPSGMLHSGNYVLTLEGLSSTGRYVPTGHYRFRVVTP
jgi:methionine-rich copper-binding protein CopC